MSDYFATKYDSAACEVIAILASVGEGYGSAESGDVESPAGFFAAVTLDSYCDLDFADHTNYPLGDDAGETARKYGVTAEDVTGHHLVITNDQGFVSVLTYDTREERDAAYAAQDAVYAAWLDTDDLS